MIVLEDSGLSTLVMFESVLIFYFLLLKSNHSFLYPFLEITDKCCSIFGAVTPNLLVYHRLDAFKRTGMVHYNRTSLMILVNDAKYIHLLLVFSTSLGPFTLQV